VVSARDAATRQRNGDMTTRRKLLIGAAASLLCAPTIVRVGSLMPARKRKIQQTVRVTCDLGIGVAAVDEDVLSGHKIAVGAGQKDERPKQVLWKGVALQRAPGQNVLARIGDVRWVFRL
jgi:hypothetical protein